MVKRTTITRKRRALADDLREAVRAGTMAVGDMLPPTRALASKYGLSHATVARQLEDMVGQGLLRGVPRVGVFVARAFATSGDLYLVLQPSRGGPSRCRSPWTNRTRMGFEQRIAELGGSSLMLPADIAAARCRNGGFAGLAGVLDVSGSRNERWCWDPRDAMPTVQVGIHSLPGREIPPGLDVVNFDDVDGGRQAVAHLVEFGCQRVAYLGLHSGPRPTLSYDWSLAREMGWEQAAKAAGLPVDGLVFLPHKEPVSFDDELDTAAGPATALIEADGVDGVVCANDHVALAVLNALAKARRPHDRWPAIVGFDGLADAESVILTSARLPWEEVGRTAADVLWRRHTGRLTGPSQRFAVPMSLIPRMSSRPAWSERVSDLLRVPP